MKIYIAAPFAARELVRNLSAYMNHECTSTWALSTREITEAALGASWVTSDEDALLHAQGDLNDISRSDALIMLTAPFCLRYGVPDARLHTGGRHVEFGWALAQGKALAVVGEPENIFLRTLASQHAFFTHAVEALEQLLVQHND